MTNPPKCCSWVSKSCGCSCARAAVHMLVGTPAGLPRWRSAAGAAAQSRRQRWCWQWPSARASLLPEHWSGIRGWLVSPAGPAWCWARTWVLCVGRSGSYSIQMPVGIAVSVPELFSRSWTKLWVTGQAPFRYSRKYKPLVYWNHCLCLFGDLQKSRL